jgi:signal transduction histidine kinase
MKPLLSESLDKDALQALGRASVQIVHDLKNHLNGLKLYATFLRKRMEKDGGRQDELETVNKLIAGLDRTAKEVSMISLIGRPLELRKQTGVDLEKLLREIVVGLNAESANGQQSISGSLSRSVVFDAVPASLTGTFDPLCLSDALKWVSLGAMKLLSNRPRDVALEITLRSDAVDGKTDGVIEWRGLQSLEHDPFHSFAGSDEIRLSLAAKVIEAHGGAANHEQNFFRVRLPLTSN